MSLKVGGVLRIAKLIELDLEFRDTSLSKPQMDGLADTAASVLSCRSVNTSELAMVLPRKVSDREACFRYIHRWLSNDKIKPEKVMCSWSTELMELLSEQGQSIVLMMDQSKMSEGFEILMISIRAKERALPILWKVVETKGEIGFDVQEPLLRAVARMIPAGIKTILMAHRFYGTPSLVGLCQELGMGYRIRLKRNLTLHHEGAELSGREMAKLGLSQLENAKLCGKVLTNIGFIHESPHEDSWVIAMDAKSDNIEGGLNFAY